MKRSMKKIITLPYYNSMLGCHLNEAHSWDLVEHMPHPKPSYKKSKLLTNLNSTSLTGS